MLCCTERYTDKHTNTHVCATLYSKLSNVKNKKSLQLVPECAEMTTVLCLYLYGKELDVRVVVFPPQPAQGLLSLLLLAQREEPPGGAGHEHQQHGHQQSRDFPGHCQPPPRQHQTCTSADGEMMINREWDSSHCIQIYCGYFLFMDR